MPEAVRIFISHHHSPDEDAFTERLVRDLEAAKADVWLDTKGITSDDFVSKISEGLAGRQWLVLVMTPEAVASPWVRREVNAALNEHTAGRMLGVLPLVMHPCAEDEIPILWRPLHRYDATGSYEAGRDRLFATLGLAPLPDRTNVSDLQDEYRDSVQRHRFDLALDIAERMISMDEQSANAWNNKSYALNELERHKEALDASDRAIALNPNVADAWNNNAWALVRLKRFEEALLAIERCIAISGAYGYMWNTKAEALLGLDRAEEALGATEQATSLAPEWAWGWIVQGDALQRLARFDEAVVAYKKALSLAPHINWLRGKLHEAETKASQRD